MALFARDIFPMAIGMFLFGFLLAKLLDHAFAPPSSNEPAKLQHLEIKDVLMSKMDQISVQLHEINLHEINLDLPSKETSGRPAMNPAIIPWAGHIKGSDQNSKAFDALPTQSWLTHQNWPMEFARCNSDPQYIQPVHEDAGDYFKQLLPQVRNADLIHCSYASGYMPIMQKLATQPLPNAPEEKLSYVLDVGCNIGLFTFPVAALGHHVICFEPVPENVATLTRGVQANGFQDRVTIVHTAVSAKSGSTNFTVIVGQTDCSTLIPNSHQEQIAAQYGGSEVINVDIVSIDEWLDAHPEIPKDKIQFFKVDVEGHEYGVFKGAERFLKQHGSHVQIEAEFVPFLYDEPRVAESQGISSPSDIPSLLRSIGYKFQPCQNEDLVGPAAAACEEKWVKDNYRGIGQNVNYIWAG